MRVGLAQINPTPGDVEGNVRLLEDAWTRLASDGAQVVVAPELAIVGYPPRDLLLRTGLLRAAAEALDALAKSSRERPPLVVGTVVPNPAATGRPLWNAACVLAEGALLHTYAKQLLPTYDVFDEVRYFEPGTTSGVAVLPDGTRVGLLVCEDLWGEDTVRGRRLYDRDPVADLADASPDVVVGISASPYHGGKDPHRSGLFQGAARRLGVPLVTVNQVGGNDDVLFDGRSRAFDGAGRTLVALPGFVEAQAVVDLASPERVPDAMPLADAPARAEEVRRALVMGVRDYARKTGFTRALLGLSGGVDSAVTAGIAADALGGDAVLGVGMPGPFTSAASNEDAADLAQRLGIGFRSISIVPAYEAALASLTPHFEGKPFDVAEENLQARLRGLTLMALSNKHGHLVLTTGNKSEVAVGYCTLYGDMNGGLAVLSDVWKTMVYDLARLYEAEGRMPSRTITRPPSAELRENQTDQDSLPPYEVLDRILRALIEEGQDAAALEAAGEDPALVARILRLVDRSEYKRWQMAPGLKVSPIAFGVGWRMPLAKRGAPW